MVTPAKEYGLFCGTAKGPGRRTHSKVVNFQVARANDQAASIQLYGIRVGQKQGIFAR